MKTIGGLFIGFFGYLLASVVGMAVVAFFLGMAWLVGIDFARSTLMGCLLGGAILAAMPAVLKAFAMRDYDGEVKLGLIFAVFVWIGFLIAVYYRVSSLIGA